MEIGAIGHQSALYGLPNKERTDASTQIPGQQEKMKDLSLQQKGVKEQVVTLKADNDLFGALKTLERSVVALGAIVKSADSGNLNLPDALEGIAERMSSTQYKGMNLFEHFPLEDGTTIDMSTRIALDGSADLSQFAQNLESIGKEVATNLKTVKDRIMGGTQAMGAQVQASYERSGMDRIDPASIVANTDVDYLKTQFKRLMG